MGEAKFVITAVSRLSGNREVVAASGSEVACKRLLDKWKRIPARKRVWLRLRMYKAPWQEEWLPFSGGGG